jgi:hypothetical protein
MISLAKPTPKNQANMPAKAMEPNYPRLELEGAHAHKLGLHDAKVGDEVHMHVKGRVKAIGEAYGRHDGKHPPVTLHLTGAQRHEPADAETPTTPNEEKTMAKKPIEIKPSHRGLLHRRLGVAQGKKIPNFMLDKAKNSSDPSLRRQATFAKNAASWHH